MKAEDKDKDNSSQQGLAWALLRVKVGGSLESTIYRNVYNKNFKKATVKKTEKVALSWSCR